MRDFLKYAFKGLKYAIMPLLLGVLAALAVLMLLIDFSFSSIIVGCGALISIVLNCIYIGSSIEVEKCEAQLELLDELERQTQK